MRKAKYSTRQVRLPNASYIGYSKGIAKPGDWVRVVSETGESPTMGRVLGRIERADRDGDAADGWLAVMMLAPCGTFAYVCWVDPREVRECWSQPPAALLTWITGDAWVRKGQPQDIARMVAMSMHGTLNERSIASRDAPDKPYNDPARRDAYCAQYVLEF